MKQNSSRRTKAAPGTVRLVVRVPPDVKVGLQHRALDDGTNLSAVVTAAAIRYLEK